MLLGYNYKIVKSRLLVRLKPDIHCNRTGGNATRIRPVRCLYLNPTRPAEP